MKFHILKLANSVGVEEFHTDMFHGRANRGGRPRNYKNHRLELNVDRPLRLHKNAYRIADVFAPEYELVVSKAVRNALVAVPGVAFNPVEFETLFCYAYRAGDFSYGDELTSTTYQQKFIDSQRDVPSLHSEIGEFFELVAPPARETRFRFNDLRAVTVRFDPSGYDEPLELFLSPQLLMEFPVFSCGTSFAMNELVFSKLAPFVDRNYFDLIESSF